MCVFPWKGKTPMVTMVWVVGKKLGLRPPLPLAPQIHLTFHHHSHRDNVTAPTGRPNFRSRLHFLQFARAALWPPVSVPVVWSCESVGISSCCTKHWTVLHYLSDFRLPKPESTHCSPLAVACHHYGYYRKVWESLQLDIPYSDSLWKHFLFFNHWKSGITAGILTNASNKTTN